MGVLNRVDERLEELLDIINDIAFCMEIGNYNDAFRSYKKLSINISQFINTELTGFERYVFSYELKGLISINIKILNQVLYEHKKAGALTPACPHSVHKEGFKRP
ncbi:hypothetical protein [Terasakiella sp.]|uniref:hypothetical protein n=1 Tax=Terasakiella sp. TaxID=2034861 RepID=UPI003AA97EB3